MTTTESAARDLLQRSLPARHGPALDRARRLAGEMQYLTWPDRAQLFDSFFWSTAQATLSTDLVTAIVNRHVETFRPGSPGQTYASYCAPVATAVLMLLAEPPAITGTEQALTCLLSRDPTHQQAAVTWIERTGGQDLQPTLTRLPGYAFMFLTCCPNDTAESFMARDAFWAAMLGR